MPWAGCSQGLLPGSWHPSQAENRQGGAESLLPVKSEQSAGRQVVLRKPSGEPSRRPARVPASQQGLCPAGCSRGFRGSSVLGSRLGRADTREQS